jgi:colanic acid/amylovoran biosynthesis glycosyltransferase
MTGGVQGGENRTAAPLRVDYLFTTFPSRTETFLQREVAAMIEAGLSVRLYSLWGGGGVFHGVAVHRFPKLRLLELIGVIPWIALTRWDVFGILLRGLFTRRAPSWLNFWENMLGAGFAGLHYRRFRKDPPALVHAAWAGAPATAAWILARLNGHRFTTGAHAYDLYEHGGDWWLLEKLADARVIHTSTEMGARTLRERGIPAERIVMIRRGLGRMPACRGLRRPRRPLRLLCVARLVPKKGLDFQLSVYAALREAGLPFEARIAGDGPLRRSLTTALDAMGLTGNVRLLGHLSQDDLAGQWAWGDVLVHTGVVAPSGDRDGLPNVIPEAMAAGLLVVSTPVAGTVEAVEHGRTGLLAPVGNAAAWVDALRQLSTDDALAETLRAGARAWVEREFDATVNAGRLRTRFVRAAVEGGR